MFVLAPPDVVPQRLDLFLLSRLAELSRSRLQGLIRSGAVQVNERTQRPSYLVHGGDRIQVEVPTPAPLELTPERIPLDVRYEDEALLVVNKAAGMTVHPAPGAWSGTLVHALLHHCGDLSGINGVLRPGIVHRLDKDTTGLLVVAKSDAAHRELAAALAAHRIRRRYTAVVWGRPAAAGVVDAPLARHPVDRLRMAVVPGGRRAVTHYRVCEALPVVSVLEVVLETGRTHQIRVHMQHLGYPVFGDPVYAGRNQAGGLRPDLRPLALSLLATIQRQALHASQLSFSHPLTGAEVTVTAPLPADMEHLLGIARRGGGAG